MSQILTRRTVKTNIIIYPTDGTGRDGYITYNNGGFWKDNIKRFSLDEKYKRSSFARYRSIRKIPPIWNYHADGTGRDSYVFYDYGGLINNFYKVPNPNIFRTSNEEKLNDYNKTSNQFLTKDEKIYQTKITKIQKDVVNRLYYKPKNEFKLNRFKRENSYGNVIRNLKLEPIKTNTRYNNNINDNENNNINDNINNLYFNNNSGLRSRNRLNKIFIDENKISNEETRNKYDFRKYKIKCLSNDFDNKDRLYPFNHFSRKNSDKKFVLFN